MPRINLRTLKAVAIVAGRDPARPSLRGVLVECQREQTLYIAADNHRMLVAREAGGSETGRFLVPLDVIRTIKASDLKPDETDTLEFDGCTSCTLKRLGRVFTSDCSTYPDWRRTVPPAHAGASLARLPHYNAGYLTDFAKFARIMGPKAPPGNGYRIFARDEKSAAAVLFPNVPGAFGAIMPIAIRAENEPTWKPPLWSKAP